MKRLLITVIAMTMAIATCFAQERTREEINKERKEIRKMAKEELTDKVDKTTRKEAKKLEEEGWKVKPGALPLEKQLEKSYLMQMEFDDDLYPKYLMGEASSIGENYDAAKVSALSLAITNLAGQIQTEVSALVENTVANSQLSAGDATSITKTIMSSKNLISQSIGRTLTVVECYRTNSKGNNEVLVRIFYSGKMAKQVVQKSIREQLEKEGDNLGEELDKILAE